jgi:xanthine dehydrogenase accessory factor
LKDYNFWLNVISVLKSGKKSILIVVINHDGSTPGKQGFKMLISETGEQFGTIGGGIMERNVVDVCERNINENQFNIKYLRQSHYVNAPENERSGLMCSGNQELAMFVLNTSILSDIQYIVDSYTNNNYGILELNQHGARIEKNKQLENKFSYAFESESSWQYGQNFGVPNIAYVFGGGHVGTAICRILATLDFYIVQFDHRQNLEIMKEHNFAHEKIICPFDEVGKHVNRGQNVYFIVVTHSSDTDGEVLKNIINIESKYTGLMGSKTKIARIFNILRKNGISEDMIRRVHAPIGIDINDLTVEEIAISVAAELIQIKNKDLEH